ncbi:helix-turn-helix domain-containing protein [Methylosinus sp. Sm6]|jgi:DNA-binding HxlR family transcriptional regulator|uniref:winged helix-turn-helix transcriptional regulator n=1 Tax=Methylosinus sp. Sm6 TaxID=2866948 RepID=UPI001C99038B|nr:helix-turn-helix domain-containing protein [Methylosinus sp. Sm6]MBY6240338.1 helix-turn-helix transcriptional regulator [Methylosinus sp. Sm6]
MTRNATAPRRSNCPLNVCLEIFGDRWTLLIVRDLLFKQRYEFKDYLAAKEKIASNILSDRLRRLEENQIITKSVHPTDARRVDYRLTDKGLDLAPLLFEMALWATKHEETDAPTPLLRRMSDDRENLLAELRANHLGSTAESQSHVPPQPVPNRAGHRGPNRTFSK